MIKYTMTIMDLLTEIKGSPFFLGQILYEEVVAMIVKRLQRLETKIICSM